MNFNTEEKDVYLIRAILTDGSLQYKIGVSKHPKKRLLENKTSNPNQLQLIATYHSTLPYLVETALKNHYKLQQIEGEWFNLESYDIENFETLCKKFEDNLKIVQTSSLFNQSERNF